MADLPAIFTRDLCTNNPFLIFPVEVGFVDGVVVPMPDFKLDAYDEYSWVIHA